MSSPDAGAASDAAVEAEWRRPPQEPPAKAPGWDASRSQSDPAGAASATSSASPGANVPPHWRGEPSARVMTKSAKLKADSASAGRPAMRMDL